MLEWVIKEKIEWVADDFGKSREKWEGESASGIAEDVSQMRVTIVTGG